MSNLIKNLLTEYGYEMVALPKADIAPLLLLRKEGDYLSSMHSNVELLFEEDIAALPAPTTTTTVANISGKNTLRLDGNMGLKALSGLFDALKLKDSDIKTHFAASKNLELEFSFENVQEDKVDYVVLDNFFSGAIPLEKEFKSSMELLKRSELYVVTTVLKSNHFSIKIGNSNSQDAELKLALEKMGALDTKFKREKDNVFSITTEGEESLVFAFKAVQILYDKASWFEFWKPKEAEFRIRKQKGMVLRGTSDFPVINLKTESGISDI
jgi:hypothetical protein